MKCLYRNYCRLYGTEECNQYCTRYKLIQYLLDSSMIPKNRQVIKEFFTPQLDEKEYGRLRKVCRNIKEYVDNGYSFVLYSENTGNGKTSWAIQMMIAYFDAIWHSNGFKPRGYFLHVPTYLNRVKASINNKDEELEEINKNLTDIDMLILDDIGTNAMSDYDISLLTNIIDQRWLNQKTTIYTTNRSAKKLKEVLGERITDRIMDSVKFHFLSPSNRGL